MNPIFNAFLSLNCTDWQCFAAFFGAAGAKNSKNTSKTLDFYCKNHAFSTKYQKNSGLAAGQRGDPLYGLKYDLRSVA